MKIVNGEQSPFDSSGALAPWLFYGQGAPSTDQAFMQAPLDSLYWDVTHHIIYVRTAQNMAAADWAQMAALGSTLTGSLTISGTLTAGDVVATNA